VGLVPIGPGTVSVREGHGACFCCQGTNYIELWVRSRYKFYKWSKSSHGSRTLVNGHMRSIALQVVREPVNSHDTKNLLACRCASPGEYTACESVMVADTKAKTVTSLLTQLTVLCAARLCQLFIVIIT
jgi:hypothetical protein